MGTKVQVLVVDDSAFFCRRISEMLSRHPEIEVVGVANNGLDALKQVHELKPDVVTMDVEMPTMDGIAAARQIMAEVPTPILMLSALTKEGAKATLEALDAGAVDFLPKQPGGRGQGGDSLEQMLVQRVLALAPKRARRVSSSAVTRDVRSKSLPAAWAATPKSGSYDLVAIGASTGGPIAVQKLLSALPGSFPLPIIVIVHMPASFTPTFAERMDGLCRISVKEAARGDRLQAGHAYLAPGGKQMLLAGRRRGSVTINIEESSQGQIYRPCVDITFESAAKIFPSSVLAVILTGMGSDGMQGAKLLHQGGSTVWSQDEASCVVYGMPQAVERAGISDLVMPLDNIGPAVGKVS